MSNKRSNFVVQQLVEDERFYEKKNYLFRKVWGMRPSDGASMNALTENVVDFKYDPLYNGISLDLINDKPGGVANSVDFGDNALFKLKSFQAPVVVANTVKADQNFDMMTDADYHELKRMHDAHANNDYRMAVYEDESYEILTFPNYNFSGNKGHFSIKMGKTLAPGYLGTSWQRYLDQRILFQISPQLIESDKAYDTKVFRYSTMQDRAYRTSTTNNKNETASGQNNLALKPSTHVFPCTFNKISRKWEVVDKKDFEEEYKVKQLATDTIETYKVMDCQKLFGKNNKVKWCVDFGELDSVEEHRQRDLRQMYKIWFDRDAEVFRFRYVMSKEDMYAMSVRRFYTRFVGDDDERKPSPNAKFYNKLISSGQFTKRFFREMKGVIPLDPLSDDVNANKHLYYEQYVRCRRDTDTATNTPSATLNEPRPRVERCVSAYNPITKELVVQFMPILEDRHLIHRDTATRIDWKDPANSYQVWFFDKMREMESRLGYDLDPLPGCKRRIFALHLENDEDKTDPGSIGTWSRDNAPLFYLHVKYVGSKENGGSVDAIEIKFHNNCEYLGFNVYGNPETIYGIERFYTELITLYVGCRVWGRENDTRYVQNAVTES